MKMLLLIVSLLLFSCCDSTDADSIRIDNYEFHSLHAFNEEINVEKDVNVIDNIKKSKKIKGPVVGIDVKTMFLINKTKGGDTLKVIIYGKDNKYFRIGNEFYESKKSIISK